MDNKNFDNKENKENQKIQEKEIKKIEKQENQKNIKQKLTKKVEVPIFIIIGMILLFFIISLFTIRVPYKAKEKYSEIEYYVVEVNEISEDKENPQYEKVCIEKEFVPNITDLYVYGKNYGVKDYKCYAEFRVANDKDIEGYFIYKFVFDINGKRIETEEKKEFITKFSLKKYYFETNCSQGDKPTGQPILIKAPNIKDCHYETFYPNITITKNETKQREVLKERIVEKTESLFEKLIGKNKIEKIN